MIPISSSLVYRENLSANLSTSKVWLFGPDGRSVNPVLADHARVLVPDEWMETRWPMTLYAASFQMNYSAGGKHPSKGYFLWLVSLVDSQTLQVFHSDYTDPTGVITWRGALPITRAFGFAAPGAWDVGNSASLLFTASYREGGLICGM